MTINKKRTGLYNRCALPEVLHLLKTCWGQLPPTAAQHLANETRSKLNDSEHLIIRIVLEKKPLSGSRVSRI